MPGFSNHAKISAGDIVDVHERPNSHIALEEGSPSEGYKAILYCLEIGESKVWDIDSVVQKPRNRAVYTVRKYEGQSGLVDEEAHGTEVSYFLYDWGHARLGKKNSHETIQGGRGKSIDINRSHWPRN